MLKPKPISDYILIRPDAPTAGAFQVGDTYIDEVGIIEECGPECSDELRKLKGKKIIFNAWACDQKTIGGKRFYFAPESANAICATI